MADLLDRSVYGSIVLNTSLASAGDTLDVASYGYPHRMINSSAAGYDGPLQSELSASSTFTAALTTSIVMGAALDSVDSTMQGYLNLGKTTKMEMIF